MPAAVVRRPQPSLGNAVIVEVRDEHGRPLSDAGVWSARPGRHAYRRAEVAFLGATDEGGEFLLGSAAADSAIVVGKAGYVTRELLPANATRHVVTLSVGETVEMQCLEYGTNAPLEGACLAASMAAMPGSWSSFWSDFSEYEGDVIGPGSDAVICGRSTREGVLRISGLPRGVPRWRIRCPGYTLVECPGLKPTGRLDPGVEVQFPGSYVVRFAALVACGYVVRGDDLVAATGSSPERNDLGSGFALLDSAFERERLGREYPDATICVVAIRDRSQPLTAELHMEFATRGQQDVVLSFVPVAEFLQAGPTIVDVTDRAAAAAGSAAQIVVELVNPDGTPLPVASADCRWWLAGDGER